MQVDVACVGPHTPARNVFDTVKHWLAFLICNTMQSIPDAVQFRAETTNAHREAPLLGLSKSIYYSFVIIQDDVTVK